jgi:hypothetical protein
MKVVLVRGLLSCQRKSIGLRRVHSWWINIFREKNNNNNKKLELKEEEERRKKEEK